MTESANKVPGLNMLSNEHHESLFFVWKVRQGLVNGTPIELVGDYCVWYWKNYIKPHFCREEQVLFSFIAADDKLMVQLKQHRKDLHELFMELRQCADPLLIGMFASLLEFHIRFEERIFFPYLQQKLSPAESEIAFSLLKNIADPVYTWKEPFWQPK